jgi:pyruvate kinase
LEKNKHKTKIGCTLGPANSEVPQIIGLVDAGMSLARLNICHGNAKDNKRIIRNYF